MSEVRGSIDPIIALTPLKLLIVAEKNKFPSDDRSPYFTAITRAFQGGAARSPDGTEEYYASGEELGVDVRRIIGMEFWSDDSRKVDISVVLESCCHLLVIVFLEGPASAEFGHWLSKMAQIALREEFEGRVGVLPIALDPQGEQVSLEHFDEFQRLSVSELGEGALRPGYMGLLALQHAWSLLGAGADERLRLFVSHAKRDGAPVALALKSQIESLRFLRRFYDAQDILPGTRWRQVLREGVRKSVIVALRTDIYELRPWCVQEIEWAEEFGCPAIVVDARHSLTMPRETLPVAGMATVRIPDGNMVRILNMALREAVRVRLFRRAVQMLEAAGILPANRTIALSRASLASLGVACEAQVRAKRPIEAVVIAEAFRESHRSAAERLVHAYFSGATLGTVRDYVSH